MCPVAEDVVVAMMKVVKTNPAQTMLQTTPIHLQLRPSKKVPVSVAVATTPKKVAAVAEALVNTTTEPVGSDSPKC